LTPGIISLSLWAEWQLDYEGFAAWSPDSQYIVFTDDNIYGQDDRTYMYDVNTLEPVWQINDSMSSITFSPDGKYIVSAGRRLRFFDAASGELINSPYEGNAQLLSAYFPDGTTLLIGRSWIFSEEDTLTEIGEWDDEKQNLNIIIEHEGYLNTIALSPDGKHLATSFALLPGIESGLRIFLWDLATKSKHCDLPGEDAIFSPVGNILATTDTDGKITLFDTSSCQPLKTIHEVDYISSLSFSPDGQMLAYSGIPFGVLWIRNVATGELLYQQEGLRESITYLDFSPDGKYLLLISLEKTSESNDSLKYAIQIWQMHIPPHQ
jgi:WD40 repeat protein